MVENVTKIRVFIASPGDVQTERDSMSGVIQELNSTIGERHGFVIELVKWETHCHPAMGRPQGVINEQIGPYDIFIGIMWKRFGSPTGVAESGTEEEFRRAYSAWRENRVSNILFYFSQEPFMPQSQEENEQMRKVLFFKEEFARNELVWKYANAGAFADTVRPHLARILLMNGISNRVEDNKQITFDTINTVVKKIIKMKSGGEEEEKVELPADIKEKIKENKLSSKFEDILRMQMRKFSQIDKFFESGVLRKQDFENLSFSLKMTYLRFRNKYDNGDDIFIAMIDHIIPPDISEEEYQGYCALICYFFHSCGVFENVNPE